MLPRGLGEGEKRSDCLISKEFRFEGDENVSLLNSGASCIILNIRKITELDSLKE